MMDSDETVRRFDEDNTGMSSENIYSLVQKAVDAFEMFVENGADPEKVREASLPFESLCSQESNVHVEAPIRDLAFDITESLQITMDWLTRREDNRRGFKKSHIMKQVAEYAVDSHLTSVPNKHVKTEDGERNEIEDFSPLTDAPIPEGSEDEESVQVGAWSNDDDSGESGTDTDEVRKKKSHPRRDKNTQCDECGKSFTTAGTLRVHKLTHLDDDIAKRPYACDQCDKRFTQAGSLSVHRRRHMAKDDPRLLAYKRVWGCEICGKNFPSRPARFSHKMTHLGDQIPQEAARKRPHKCEDCDKRFGSKLSLRRHAILHTGVLAFHCKLCTMNFTTKQDLNDHTKYHAKGTARVFSGDFVSKNHKCTLCTKKFRKEYELAAHLKRHAEDAVGFSSDDEEVAVDDQMFKCSKCWKSFELRSKLKRHENDIHGVLPYPCPHCKKKYLRPMNLQLHMRSKHGVEMAIEPCSRPPASTRPFKCEVCPATFRTQFALDKHGHKHAEPSSFKCSKCSEEFTSYDLLIEHKRSVHNLLSYVCRACGTKFKEYAELTDHKTVCVKKVIKPPKPPVIKICSNCGVRQTSSWRRTERGVLECNSCSLYFKLNGLARPESLWTNKIRKRARKPALLKQSSSARTTSDRRIFSTNSDDSTEEESDLDPVIKICSNCGVNKTSSWRRTEKGVLECNSCSLYFKLHGLARPESLWSDKIRKRMRKPARLVKKQSSSSRTTADRRIISTNSDDDDSTDEESETERIPGAWSDDQDSDAESSFIVDDSVFD